MQYLSLGQKLRNKRKELNLTLKDVTGSFISPATLSLVERDLQVPSDDLLRYLAETLKTPLHYFRETPEELLGRRAKTLLVEAEVLMRRGRYAMATRCAAEILADAQELKQSDLIGQSALLLARIALTQGQFSQANHHLFQAQSATLIYGQHELLPSIYYTFGQVSYCQGFFTQALDYFLQAEQTDAHMRDSEQTRKIHIALADSYHKIGDYDRALAYADKAKQSIQRLNDYEAHAESLLLVGASYREKEQYDLALAAFEEALRVIRQADAKSFESDVDSHLAQLYVKLGRTDKASEHYELAFAQKQALQAPSAVSIALDYVELLLDEQQWQKAEERLQTVFALLAQHPQEEERARALALSFQLHSELQNEPAGRAALEESLSIVRRQPHQPKRLADTLVRLGRISAKRGDAATASLLFTEALTGYENLSFLLNRLMT